MSISGTVVAILAWLLIIGQEPPALDLTIITGVKKNTVRHLFRLSPVLCSFWSTIKLHFSLSTRFSFYSDGEEDSSRMATWNHILFYSFENFNSLPSIHWGFMSVTKRCRFGRRFYLNLFLAIPYQLNPWLAFELVIAIHSMRSMFLISIPLDHYCPDWSKAAEG